MYTENWGKEVDKLSKCLNHRIYKTEHKLESYFVKLAQSLGTFYLRFRCMNHRLPIKFGRFIYVERSNGKCKLCKSGEMGDKYHYLFQCSFFKHGRRKRIAPYFYRDPNILKFSKLTNIEDNAIMTQLAIFC